MAMVVHFVGYSIVMVVFYGYSNMGLVGANLGRFTRLLSLLWALQLPWVVVGDFNMSLATLSRSGIVERLSAVVLSADVAATCNQGSGTHIDYVMCSRAALPFIVRVNPVVRVPWKPHIGLDIEFRSSGEQLLTRVLELPGKLPQAPRPRVEPTPGSKSSVARAQRSEQQHLAVSKRAEKCHTLFGDCGEQSSATPADPEEGENTSGPAGGREPDPAICEFDLETTEVDLPEDTSNASGWLL